MLLSMIYYAYTCLAEFVLRSIYLTNEDFHKSILKYWSKVGTNVLAVNAHQLDKKANEVLML